LQIIRYVLLCFTVFALDYLLSTISQSCVIGLIVYQLLRGEVDFEDVEEEPNGDVLIRSPGLGELLFEKGDIFPIADTSDTELDTQ
jgi:hypothetical protein